MMTQNLLLKKYKNWWKKKYKCFIIMIVFQVNDWQNYRQNFKNLMHESVCCIGNFTKFNIKITFNVF